MADEKPNQVILPGDDLPLSDQDITHATGKYLLLYEWEQRKRLILAQAYVTLKAERDRLQDTLEQQK